MPAIRVPRRVSDPARRGGAEQGYPGVVRVGENKTWVDMIVLHKEGNPSAIYACLSNRQKNERKEVPWRQESKGI